MRRKQRLAAAPCGGRLVHWLSLKHAPVDEDELEPPGGAGSAGTGGVTGTKAGAAATVPQ